ncbi:MAG TPA: hypothetical protein ENG83_06590 [Nitrospirae bacterium]|nr:hypothetical protein BMS3Abin06_01060 [bacterium BMS3Abin06]HDH11848.1 hypothetical protein [Nitrospirota bacterium]HDZ02810.1 hypothetical protein [Nitrospirota bacterium]
MMNYKSNIKYALTAITVTMFLSVISAFVSAQSAKAPQAMPPKSGMPGPGEYWPSSLCQGCHDKIFYQHLESMHANSFENPVFQAAYFKKLLPDLAKDGLAEEAKACIACHAPVTYAKKQRYIVSKEEVDPDMSGVICDFCHTISGYKGKSPGNANYISTPGYRKLGPFKHETNWHHVYSELQTKSEFCAICHNRTNHHGLEIISTFTEWRNSSYAKEGIQCQDCHMNILGFLAGGLPIYESGKAAQMRPGYAPYRAKLYTHRFPGAHSESEVTGALTLTMEIDKTTASPGDEIMIDVFVDNSRTGHKMPSGSAELRLLFLDLNASVGDNVISIPAGSDMKTDMYDVSGKGKFDDQILAKGILKGSRIYRAVCLDKNGEQTLFSYDAFKIIFDNRLNASEIRKETYRFKVPENAKGSLELTAGLYYLRYPGSFAKQLGLPEAKVSEIASTRKILSLK